MRSWSVRNARWLKRAYEGLETVLVWLNPVLRRVGHERLDKPFLAVEKMTKGVLFDSQGCGQCIIGSTGMSCPMNCPKQLRNGPCGGVRDDGSCEIKPEMPCVWVLVDNRLIGTSAWLREVRHRTGASSGTAREV
jgi:hypothetical protein